MPSLRANHGVAWFADAMACVSLCVSVCACACLCASLYLCAHARPELNSDPNAALPPLVIVGHSVGGFVARAAPLLPNHPHNFIKAIVALVTPQSRWVPRWCFLWCVLLHRTLIIVTRQHSCMQALRSVGSRHAESVSHRQ